MSIGSADPNICVPGHSFDLEELLTLLCKDRNFVFLDEPDKNLNYTDKLLLINFIGRVQHTFKEIWIVTHYEGFMFIPDREVYKDRSNQYILMGRRVDRYNAGRDVAIIRENNQKFTLRYIFMPKE